MRPSDGQPVRARRRELGPGSGRAVVAAMPGSRELAARRFSRRGQRSGGDYWFGSSARVSAVGDAMGGWGSGSVSGQAGPRSASGSEKTDGDSTPVDGRRPEPARSVVARAASGGGLMIQGPLRLSTVRPCTTIGPGFEGRGSRGVPRALRTSGAALISRRSAPLTSPNRLAYRANHLSISHSSAAEHRAKLVPLFQPQCSNRARAMARSLSHHPCTNARGART